MVYNIWGKVKLTETCVVVCLSFSLLFIVLGGPFHKGATIRYRGGGEGLGFVSDLF